ncbi:MAG: CcmD family protein [Chloroflexi bacterium]|nr:CcmD family protein [Chloroflexota bacterium]
MNLEYVFVAYAVILFAIFAYVFSFSRRQSKIERELEELRRALEGGEEHR